MGRKRSVCRLASQTQLLTVCLTPPTPTLPVLSNVSSRTECETTEIKGASRLWTTPIPPNPRIKVWFVPGPVLLSRLQTSCTSSSESEVRQMEVTHGSRRPTQYPPSGKALASAVRQSSFFPGLQFHEWWNLLSGENWFLLTVSNPAMTVSVHSTGWGTGGFGSTAHLLGDMGQVASPLQAPAASSALLLGGVTIKWNNECKARSNGPARNNCWINSSCCYCNRIIHSSRVETTPFVSSKMPATGQAFKEPLVS